MLQTTCLSNQYLSFGFQASQVRNLRSLKSLLTFLFDEAVAVGVEQFTQVGYLFFQFRTDVGIGYQHTLGSHLNDLRGALDVDPAFHRVFLACKRLMLYKLEAA